MQRSVMKTKIGYLAAVGLMTVVIFEYIWQWPVSFMTKSQYLNAESHEELSDETYHTTLEPNLDNKIGESRPKVILFFNPAKFQLVRNVLKTSFFSKCEVKNCEMVFDKKKVNEADAVIIHTKYLTKLPSTQRRKEQIWIMIQHESPIVYRESHEWIWKNKINWTMTYSRNSDIHLPYGRLVLKKSKQDIKRNYESIAANKSKDALWVVSHCNTQSQRNKYVKILKNYIRVDILGRCGEKWDCGMRSNHSSGNCFDILNSTYRFYLAFENALCDEYITEKFYENYNYDIIQVVRGGRPNTNPLNVSNNVFINANDFENAHELGKYLKALSKNPSKYASILKEKDKYKNVPYMELLQQAACNICKRLHNVDNCQSVYTGIRDWMATNEGCYPPNDI